MGEDEGARSRLESQQRPLPSPEVNASGNAARHHDEIKVFAIPGTAGVANHFMTFITIFIFGCMAHRILIAPGLSKVTSLDWPGFCFLILNLWPEVRE